MQKIVFNPTEDPANLYPKIFKDYLSKQGIECISLKKLITQPKSLKTVKLIHLNWFENISGSNQFFIFFNFVMRATVIYACKLFAFKLVWTIHNKAPHDNTGSHFKRKIMSLLLRKSDAIIIHSFITKDVIRGFGKVSERKIYHVPHPNYIGLYGPIKSRDLKSEKLELLFLGAAKPYKNLEILIDVVKSFKGDVNLKIAGKPISLDYANTIAESVKNAPYIKLDLQFIKDSELPRYLSNCDLVVLPYDTESSLNSGSVILAFSYQRSVICPSIGTITDLTNRTSVFQYTYNGSQEHFDQLRTQIAKANEMFKEDVYSLRTLGEMVFEEVSLKNSIEKSGRALIGVYKRLHLSQYNQS